MHAFLVRRDGPGAQCARAPALGLDVIAGSGHDPTLEAPAALADAIAAAVTRLTRARPS